MTRKDISKLRKNTAIYFKIGLILALTFTIYAFNWTTYNPVIYTISSQCLTPEIEIDVIRTPNKVKPIPPPSVVQVIKDIDPKEQREFTNLPEPEPLEKTNISEHSKRQDFDLNNEPPKPAEPTLRLIEPEINVPDLFKVVEDMPRFRGCENEDLSKEEKTKCSNKNLLSYVYEHIRYPAIARENGITGMVVIQFVIEKDGSISDAKIVRDIRGGCGKEALRVVNAMPKWTPGLQRKQPVRVQFNLPVKFRLD